MASPSFLSESFNWNNKSLLDGDHDVTSIRAAEFWIEVLNV
jgi:hypothetical protein